MKLTIAGGAGEHGRSCFHVAHEAGAFLVDCGIEAGSSNMWPCLTDEQILSARALFLTHSHKDHTGAIDWLIGRGFQGCIVATRETFLQLGVTYPDMRALADISPGPFLGLSIEWGRSGHCIGSVWYRFSDARGAAVFSGDYTENSQVYACDPIRGAHAIFAVLDAAYGKSGADAADAMRFFLDGVPTDIPALFPVPKHGRGPEMALLLHERHPAIALLGDDTFLRTIRILTKKAKWLRTECIESLKSLPVAPLIGKPNGPCFCFLSDVQLNGPSAQTYAEEFARTGTVILSGHADEGSGARTLMDAGRARVLPFPVHQNLQEAHALTDRNTFSTVVYAHSPEIAPPENDVIN